MNKSKLVSIVTPCYNSEKYIERLLKSILSQTYDNIEFIVVNDGSTDRSEEMILSYKNKIESKGIKFIYQFQKNMGVASATENGLKKATGEYVTWIDSDDWMTSDSIQMKVDHLEKNPECALVCGRVQMVSENDTEKIMGILEYTDIAKKNVFESLLMCEGVYFAPIGYMAKTFCLKECIKDLNIYKKKDVGQNWQLLLPLTYKYRTCFMDSIVGSYLVRTKSHSHFEDSVKKIAEYNHNSQLAIVETLNRMEMSDKEKTRYSNEIIKKYGNINLRLYARNGFVSEMEELFRYLFSKRLLRPKSYAYYIYGLINGSGHRTQ